MKMLLAMVFSVIFLLKFTEKQLFLGCITLSYFMQLPYFVLTEVFLFLGITYKNIFIFSCSFYIAVYLMRVLKPE